MKYALFVPLATAASLLTLYLNFAGVFVRANLIRGATVLELGIFLLQFGKIVTVASLKRLRNAQIFSIIDILAAELLILFPALLIAYLYFGVKSAPVLMTQVFLAWVAGVAAFGTPYAMYRLTRAMVRGETLAVVLPSAVFLSEFLVLLVAGANVTAASGLGLSALSRAILLVGLGTHLSPVTGTEVAGLTTFFPLAILYVSLLLYALAPGSADQHASFRSLAGLGLLATAVTYAGTYAASQFAVALTYIVLPPALLTVTIIWWATREV
jgi:hypothetical protein